jgi:hypothetical protein
MNHTDTNMAGNRAPSALTPKPKKSDLWLQNAARTQTQFVKAPNILTRVFSHIYHNPGEFLFTTAASFLIRGALLTAFSSTFGLGLAATIAAAMVTSALITVGKDMMKGSEPPPGDDELSKAENAEIKATLFSRTLNSALWSGAIAGLTGGLLAPLAEEWFESLKESAEAAKTAKEGADTTTLGEDDAVTKSTAEENLLPYQQEEWEAITPEEMDRFFDMFRNEDAIAAENIDHPCYNRFREFNGDPVKNLRFDDQVDRNLSEHGFVSRSPHSIPEGIGFDNSDAKGVYRQLFMEDPLLLHPRMLSSEQAALFDGKTIVIDVGHNELISTAPTYYQMGAIYDADGNHYTETEQVTLPRENGDDEVFTALKGVVDANGDPYTFSTAGPAFSAETGKPVMVESRENIRNAIQFGINAEDLGANVVYTNLGQMKIEGLDELRDELKEVRKTPENSEMFKYTSKKEMIADLRSQIRMAPFDQRHALMEELEENGHKPDILLSFHQDAHPVEGYKGSSVKTAYHSVAGCQSYDPNELLTDAFEKRSISIDQDRRNLALQRNMPFAEEGIPGIILEVGNLKNPEEHTALRAYSYERHYPIFQGLSDFFAERDRLIEAESKIVTVKSPAELENSWTEKVNIGRDSTKMEPAGPARE